MLCPVGMHSSRNMTYMNWNCNLVLSCDGSESRLGIDSTLTRHFLANSYSILLEESRLGLDRAQLFKTRTGSDSKGLTSDGSKWRLGIDLTLAWHFLADSYSIFLEKSRLGLDRARFFKTRTGSDSKGLTNDGSKWRLGIDSTLAQHFLADLYSIFLEESRLRLDQAWILKTQTHWGLTFSGSTHH